MSIQITIALSVFNCEPARIRFQNRDLKRLELLPTTDGKVET